MLPELEQASQQRVYPITKRISIGQYATPDRAYYLLENGYTHVLNVSDTASVIRASDNGFRRVVDHPIAELGRIPHETALSCLNTLHEMLTAEVSRIYLHCISCQYRSPATAWLYLIACGMDDDAAKLLITERRPSAAPNLEALAENRLARLVREHGQQHFLPLPDQGILERAY